MRKKILVTGGSGFIGKNLIEYLNKRYIVLSPSSKNLDLLDEKKVKSYLNKNKFDTVIHTAIHSATKFSTKDRSQVLMNNLRMFFNLSRCYSLYKKMFYFGSGAEYDKRFIKPKTKEELFDRHVPGDSYGFSKYIMAKAIAGMPNVYDLCLFGCFGKYEDWRIRFISNAIYHVLFDRNIPINQNVVFDYLYIDDLVKIVEKFIELKQIPYQHINVCTGKTIDLLSLAKIVREISRKKVRIKISKKGLQSEYSGNNERLIQTIGKFNFTPLDVSIKELYIWYKERKNTLQ